MATAGATDDALKTRLLIALAVGLTCLGVINFVLGPRLAAERAATAKARADEPKPTPVLASAVDTGAVAPTEGSTAVGVDAATAGAADSVAADTPVASADALPADTAVVAGDAIMEGDAASATAQPAADAARIAATSPDATTPPPAAAEGLSKAVDTTPPPSSAAGRALLPAQIHFGTALIWLKPRYTRLLDDVASAMQRDTRLRLRVRGHADARGGQGYNHKLSQKRCQAIVYYLRLKGVSPKRVEIAAFGEREPLEPRTTEKAWARNRRVELSWR